MFEAIKILKLSKKSIIPQKHERIKNGRFTK